MKHFFFYFFFFCSLFWNGLNAQVSVEQWEKLAEKEEDPYQKIKYFTLAIRQKPGEAGYYLGRGDACRMLRQHERAIANYDTALMYKPSYIQALNLRGISFLALNRIVEAEADFRTVLEYNSSISFASQQLAIIKITQKKYAEAVTLCKTALRPDADSAAVFSTLADAYLQSGQLDNAIENAEIAIKLKSFNRSLAYYVRGEAFRQKGRSDEAVADLNRVFDPYKPKASVALAFIEQKNGAYLAATNHFDEYLSDFPRDTSIQQLREQAASHLPKSVAPPAAYRPPSSKYRYGMARSKSRPSTSKSGISFASKYRKGPMPTWIDIWPPGFKPLNQGEQRSCVAMVMASLKEVQEWRETKVHNHFSPAFIYNLIRGEPDGYCDLGEGLRTLQVTGICLENSMPYRPEDYKKKPSQSAKNEAKRFKISHYFTINKNLQEVKQNLQNFVPVVAGLDLATMNEPPWNDPATNKSHAMLIIGYDDERRALKLLNSWGPNWGEKGFGWIPYDKFETVFTELYVAIDAPTPPEEKPVVPEKVPQPPTNEPMKNDPPATVGSSPTWPVLADQKPIPSTTPANEPSSAPFSYNDLWASPLEHVLLSFIGQIMSDQPFVQITNVQPVMYGPEPLLHIEGFIHVPAAYGNTANVTVLFFDARNNAPLGSTNLYFATFYGQAAVGTSYLFLPPYGVVEQSFVMHIPFSAFNTPIEYSSVYGKSWFTTRVYGVPYLYINDFGVAQGNVFPFPVTK